MLFFLIFKNLSTKNQGILEMSLQWLLRSVY